MFERTEKKHNQEKNPGRQISGRQGSALGEIGNQAMGNILADDPDDMLAHYYANDLNRRENAPIKEPVRDLIENISKIDDVSNIMNENDEENIMNEDETLDHYASNHLGNTMKGLNKPLISMDDDPLGLKIPPKKRNQNALITNLNFDDETGNAGGDRADKKKKKKDNGPEKKIAENIIEDLKEISTAPAKEKDKSGALMGGAPKKNEPQNDLPKTEEDLQPIENWNFAAQKMDPKVKPGKMKRLGSWLAYYAGKTIGKLGGIIANVFNFLTFGVATGINSWKALWKSTLGSKRDYQQRKNTGSIPGWDGMKFEDRSNSQDTVDIDFRRVPDIWSYPIAEKAADGDIPKSPIISVYISQTSRERTITNEGETGHSGIGLEFSRKNPVTGEWQRYELRYGYYMVGGLPQKSTNAVINYNKANVPGQLLDENGDLYTASRSFKANAGQVNAVLKASETYPEKGYNTYTRNCTTFAKEMLVGAANIRQAESIFTSDKINLSPSSDMKMFLAGAGAPLFKAEMENTFDKLAHKDDLNYQGFGNKMVTKEDYDRYKKSLKFYTFRSSTSDSPNAAVENIRRMEGPNTGEIGAFDEIKDEDGERVEQVTVQMLKNALQEQQLLLTNTIEQITPEGEERPPELVRVVSSVNNLMVPLVIPLGYDPDLIALPKNTLVNARSGLTKKVTDLNTLLKYYKNDKRLHESVLYIITLIRHFTRRLDKAYLRMLNDEEKSQRDEDLGDIRKDFRMGIYAFNLGDNFAMTMSPSRYEAFLQIYKTLKAALEANRRFLELGEEERTPAEEKEYQKLQRIMDLADTFEQSHRYMLEKERYNQQDVDYAFALEKREQHVENENDDLLENEIYTAPSSTASTTYKLLIMKKIFSGMSGRLEQRPISRSMEWI